MSRSAAATGRRSAIASLSDPDIARDARQSEDVDVVFGETFDLLPLGSLILLTERSRAA